VRVLNHALRAPLAVPGGGCAEVVLARLLSEKAREAFRPASPEMEAVASLCHALEQVAGQLGSGYSDPRALVRCLRAANCAPATGVASDSFAGNASKVFYGWDHFHRKVVPVVECSGFETTGEKKVGKVLSAKLLDSLPVKLTALTLGIEAACLAIQAPVTLYC